MAGGGHSGESCAETSCDGVAQARADSRATRQVDTRLQIMEGTLRACGTQGYRAVSVQSIVNGYGGYRVQFYRHFTGKAECYAAAYGEWMDELCDRLLGTCAGEPTWRQGLSAALLELADFASGDPPLARGLLIEVVVAGGPALAKREEVFERLTHAIDGARRETKSRHSPPPITATFMLGAIEASVVSALFKRRPESFAAAVPDLVEMVAGAYSAP